jgi:glycosyltransferase involved in cell wall biosynthesis
MQGIKRNPFVTCIMPTRGRRLFVSQAIKYFLRQDYPYRELIIVDDGIDTVRDLTLENPRIRYLCLDHKLTIGAKRNLACQAASGEIIVHWDDDDWMADWRLSYQVKYLLRRRADICGLNKVFYYDQSSKQAWQHICSQRRSKPWVAGGTLCYTQTFWQTNPFLNINIGEDTEFLWGENPKRVVIPPKSTFYVALIHPGNTSPKRIGNGWYSCSTEEVRHLIGKDWDFYTSFSPQNQYKHNKQKASKINSQAGPVLPLVSCIMSTYNRRSLVPHAIQYYQQQDYPNRELIIVDDGTDPVQDLVPADQRIHYFQLSRKSSLGVKRNIGCSVANGEIIIWWDDDDWYGDHRISYQVEPILNNRADITALKNSLIFATEDKKFWCCTTQLHEKMFLYGVLGGTAAFLKRLWDEGFRFPDYSVAEEAAFIKAAVHSGAQLEKLKNDDVFIYVRHNFNTWRFKIGQHLDSNGWKKVNPPVFLTESDQCRFGIKSDSDGVIRKASKEHKLEGEIDE